MRRILSFSLISLIAALTAACGSAQQTPETTAKAENTCVQPATPPKEGETPTCSDGCEWSGTECRMQRGIKLPDAAPKPKPRETAQ